MIRAAARAVRGLRPPAIRLPRGAATLAALVALACVPGGTAAAPVVYGARAGIAPGRVHLGEVAIYRGQIVHPRDRRLRWRVPATGGDLTWGPLAALHVPDSRPVPDAQAIDTLRARITVQAFVLGRFGIPGLRFESRGPRGVTVHALPTVTLVVLPIVPPADSAPNLRPVRGPLAAPWWERLPWPWIALALLLIGALVAWIVWWRRRRKPAAAPAPAPALDPAAEAFAALAALRGLHLPEHGRFAEHAFHLTRILRRFLERTGGGARPGDTTPELVGRLESAVATDELERLAGLLRAWDRVKFARAASTADEARRAEAAVEEFVRRRAAPASEKEAA